MGAGYRHSAIVSKLTSVVKPCFHLYDLFCPFELPAVTAKAFAETRFLFCSSLSFLTECDRHLRVGVAPEASVLTVADLMARMCATTSPGSLLHARNLLVIAERLSI